MKKPKVVLASGSFDPLHIGHIKYLEAARKLGDILVVAIKGNDRIKAKKKRHFMNENERKIILESLQYIDKVIVIDSPKNQPVAVEAIEYLRPDVYASGEKRMPEIVDICKKLNIKVVYGVGGKRIRSSSQLLKEYYETNWEL
jgi:cytidyltransferase-like protein